MRETLWDRVVANLFSSTILLFVVVIIVVVVVVRTLKDPFPFLPLNYCVPYREATIEVTL